MVHQVKIVSPFVNMFSDVCDHVEDIHASIILLHFHKHRRLDGKMEIGKEGVITTAILVDRGLMRSSQSSRLESLQNVAALFFGGPDDWEALGFCRRLCMNYHMILTIIRFLQALSNLMNWMLQQTLQC